MILSQDSFGFFCGLQAILQYAAIIRTPGGRSATISGTTLSAILFHAVDGTQPL